MGHYNIYFLRGCIDGLGLVMLYSASMNMESGKSPMWGRNYLISQLVWLAFGVDWLRGGGKD